VLKTALIALLFGMFLLMLNAFRHNELEHDQLHNTLTAVRDAQEKQDRILATITRSVAYMQKIRAEVTAYTLDPDEVNDPRHAADMTTPVPGKTAAVSRDLIHLLGKKVYIFGHGVRVINDLAAEGVIGTVDLLVGNKTEARKIGREVRDVVVL